MKDPYQIRWFYLRNKQNHPVGCVASVRLKDLVAEPVAFALSSLNPKDQWNKKLAREIAINRLKNIVDKPWMIRSISSADPSKIKELIIERIAQSYDRRFAQSREAAQYWLTPEAKAIREQKKLEAQSVNGSKQTKQ